MNLTRPLVSIMVPFYNARSTLARALASVLCQTYSNWECVLVDDGSVDGSAQVIRRFDDPRFVYVSLDGNQGRPVARQVALDHARGEFVCMLDADDWMYPWRIEREVEVLISHPEAALVSAGMAIIGADNQIRGVRGLGAHARPLPPLRRPGPMPLPHAPSMIRREVAQSYAYDRRLRLAQDSDFIIRILMHHSYVHLGEVLYVYSELESVTGSKVLESLSYSRLIWAKYEREFPVLSRALAGMTWAKAVVYRVLFGVGLERFVISRRSREPRDSELAEFKRAIEILKEQLRYLER